MLNNVGSGKWINPLFQSFQYAIPMNNPMVATEFSTSERNNFDHLGAVSR